VILIIIDSCVDHSFLATFSEERISLTTKRLTLFLSAEEFCFKRPLRFRMTRSKGYKERRKAIKSGHPAEFIAQIPKTPKSRHYGRTASKQNLVQSVKGAKENSKKGTAKQSKIAMKGKKEKKKNESEAVEEFYNFILSWTCNGLKLDSRIALGLEPLLDEISCVHYDDKSYFAAMKEVAIEETRAALVQSMQSTSTTLELKLQDIQPPIGEGCLILLIFSILKGENEMTRNGCAFKLLPTGNKSYDDSYNRKYTNTSSTYGNVPIIEGTLAVVAQCPAAAMITRKGSRSSERLIPIWIHKTSPLGLSVQNGLLPRGSQVTAHNLRSILSYQRMTVACANTIPPSLVQELLGSKAQISSTFSNNRIDKSYMGKSYTDNSSDLAWKDSLLDKFCSLSKEGQNQIKSLNSSQILALRECLGGEETNRNKSAVDDHRCLHLILGPPGCGKTHFLVSLLHTLVAKKVYENIGKSDKNMVKKNQNMGKIYSNEKNKMKICKDENVRILVCAPSNKAIYVALEQFLQSRVDKCKGSRQELYGNGRTDIRCALIGIEDKLELCSSSSSSLSSSGRNKSLGSYSCSNSTYYFHGNQNEKSFHWNDKQMNSSSPLLPTLVTDFTNRFLQSSSASDVYIYSYATSLSNSLQGLKIYVKEICLELKSILSIRAIKAFKFYINNNLIIPNSNIPILLINGNFPVTNMNKLIPLLPKISEKYEENTDIEIKNINNLYLKYCHIQRVFSEIENEFSLLLNIVKHDINKFYTKNFEITYDMIKECFKAIRLLLFLILHDDKKDINDLNLVDTSTIEIYKKYDLNVRYNQLDSALNKVPEYINQLVCVLNNEVLIEDIPNELVKSAHILFCTLTTAGMRMFVYIFVYICIYIYIYKYPKSYSVDYNCRYTYVCRTCVFIYIYIYIHIHLYIYPIFYSLH
jgi:hypothetical protein